MVQTRFPALKVGILGLSEGAEVATLVAGDVHVNGLFLMSLPTRPIDELLSYQFFDWPTELLINFLDPNHTGQILGSAFQSNSLTALPLVGQAWTALDSNQDQQISEATELLPAYQNFYFGVRSLLKTPQYSGWYQSFLALPAFSQIASKMTVDTIFIYQGLKDAQVRWNWVLEDSYAMPVVPTTHLYSNLGHCFSPMDGKIGEIKTTGPVDTDVLTQLTKDVLKTLK